MKVKYRRSKRVSALNKTSVSFLMTGVFLVGAIIFPQKASAAELTMMSPQLNDNVVKMQELKTEAQRREEAIKAIMPQVEEVRKEQAEVEAAKAELAAATSQLEKEIAELKVKLAEKRRLEALRIVTVSTYAPDSAGNTYAPGNCTWYAKSRRPDLPNSLGNANTWYARAQAQGFRVGTEAKANAIGTTTRGPLGHVVYVESVNKDGTINIAEMNYKGFGIISFRTTSASEFVYIYERQ